MAPWASEVLRLRGGGMGWGLANVNVGRRPGGDEHAGLRQAFKALVLRAIN